MSSRSAHKVLALLLLLPFLGWISTGLVFLFKPGYEQAYEYLHVKTYRVDTEQVLQVPPGWDEVRHLRTVLGDHLLLRQGNTWSHLRAESLDRWPRPSPADITRLLNDAAGQKSDRYGEVSGNRDGVFTTTTGVELTLDWQTLAITQRGRDTRLIGTLYRVHYLEWFGQPVADRVLGVVALTALALLVVLGVKLLARESE